MSIICSNCQHEEVEGAFFCSECATKLVSSDGKSTATINKSDLNIQTPPATTAGTPLGTDVGNSLVNLHIMKNDQILPLIGQKIFSVGRVSEGQSILPDIDLTPYDAFSQGVSRLHATIEIKDQLAIITDLGSSNGTWLNKSKIPAHENLVISHGDIITFGKLKIQALIRKP